ncbi:hypothetical protein [Alterinioella nitratireducens]|jgi:hypothetical protein|uniref:hypothetical protein n=1 Tax=Alterinioella nitratireducens TaxID=2735915 RepID=UPI004058EB6D
MRLALVLFLLLASPAVAQEWFMRAGDVLFSEVELSDRLRGNTITFHDGGEARFFEDESYSYTYANGGGTAQGQYKVNDDSTVCIDFANGFSRCDLYVLNGERLVMATEDGVRFPIRDVTPGVSD